MSIKLCRRHNSPNWYLRGTIRGLRVDESTGVTDKKQAQEALAMRQAEIVTEALHGSDTVKTFAAAVVSYLEERPRNEEHLGPLLEIFGDTKLSKIGQAEIAAAAKKLSASGQKSAATLNRQVYTPMSAVLHHAARLKWCAVPAIARPKQPAGRIDT